VRAGQASGVPIAAVLSPRRRWAPSTSGLVGALTEAAIAIRSRRHACRSVRSSSTAPRRLHAARAASGADEPAWRCNPITKRPSRLRRARPSPFDGVRILDLGVIVAGGELGRACSPISAPRSSRSRAPPTRRAASDAAGTGDEQILGADPPQRVRARPRLAQHGGRRHLRPVVAGADAVSPTSSREPLHPWAFRMRSCASAIPGSCWPKAVRSAREDLERRMGYGPLVRATTGVSKLWTSDATRVSTTPRRSSPITSSPGSPRSRAWRP
jgi:hypothetical protein